MNATLSGVSRALTRHVARYTHDASTPFTARRDERMSGYAVSVPQDLGAQGDWLGEHGVDVGGLRARWPTPSELLRVLQHLAGHQTDTTETLDLLTFSVTETAGVQHISANEARAWLDEHGDDADLAGAEQGFTIIQGGWAELRVPDFTGDWNEPHPFDFDGGSADLVARIMLGVTGLTGPLLIMQEGAGVPVLVRAGAPHDALAARLRGA
ncbi:hypothetical protein [Deinococcus maricopensis]|uniref:hypothetical protein n=1 Tax=Deinococcus maricopensis TaxID=309887 RepID=UPI0005C242CC|nr:hypothetical protein [Deinococcus maricopensis]